MIDLVDAPAGTFFTPASGRWPLHIDGTRKNTSNGVELRAVGHGICLVADRAPLLLCVLRWAYRAFDLDPSSDYGSPPLRLGNWKVGALRFRLDGCPPEADAG